MKWHSFPFHKPVCVTVVNRNGMGISGKTNIWEMTAFRRVKPEGVTANASQRHWEDSSRGRRNNSSLQNGLTGWLHDSAAGRRLSAALTWREATRCSTHPTEQLQSLKNYSPHFHLFISLLESCGFFKSLTQIQNSILNQVGQSHLSSKCLVKFNEKEGLINVYKFTAMFRQGFTRREKRRLDLQAAIIQGILTRWVFCWLTRHVWQLSSQQQFNLNRREAAARNTSERLIDTWFDEKQQLLPLLTN